MILAILEIVGNLVLLNCVIFGEIWWRSLVFVHEAVLHWVYLNIQLNGLVIAVFIGFYVIRAADHVLTLILLILGALISLVHKLFLDYIWIIVGGGYIELPQMGVASMSTSRSRCIQNIMAINAQILV